MPLTVLLLNPPGKQLYLRDYYCSKVSKAGYLTQPVDLLMLSGRLAERYELRVIDAIADRLEESRCLALIEALAPAVVISLIAAVSLDEDRAFLARLRREGRRIVVSGDVILGDTAGWLQENPWADAALLDFTSDDIVHYIDGRADGPGSMVVRSGGRRTAERRRPVNVEYTVPVPRHDLFLSRSYRFPFNRHREFATVLTDYGCPYRCSFCLMGTMGYKYRPVADVIDELRFLKGRGTRDIYFSDQTFGVNRERALDLCARMAKERFDFTWTCFSRVDLLDEDLLRAMQRAGCHTVMLGVESASDEMLTKYRKGYTVAQIRRTFKLCREKGIRTVATFILGLPDETGESALRTIAFARELDCDFASFNVAVPRMGTQLRQDSIRDGLISHDLVVMDQTGIDIAMPTLHLTREELRSIRSRAVREFYLRPGYLWRRLRGITTLYELREQVSEGLGLLRSLRKQHRRG